MAPPRRHLPYGDARALPLRTEHDEKTPLLVRRVIAYPPQLLLLEGEFGTTANPPLVGKPL
jgi:hypothetical protein